MNVVIFQYLLDIMFIISTIGIIVSISKGKRKYTTFFGVGLGLVVFLSLFIYYDFTGTDKRIAVEKQNANNIFQSKMKEPKKEIKSFDYKEEYKDVSKSISTEASDIHKEVNGK